MAVGIKVDLDVGPLKGDDPDDWFLIYRYCFQELNSRFEYFADEGKFPRMKGFDTIIPSPPADRGKEDKDKDKDAGEEEHRRPRWMDFLGDDEDIEDCVSDAFVVLALEGKELSSLDEARKYLFSKALGKLHNLVEIGRRRAGILPKRKKKGKDSAEQQVQPPVGERGRQAARDS